MKITKQQLIDQWLRLKALLANLWHRYKNLYIGRPWYVKTGVGIATFIVAVFLWLVAVDINFLWLFGKSPSMQTIVNKHAPQASEIYSADGELIGKFFSENRTPVNYEEVNPVFWHALVDTEDERFFQHGGIDFQAFAAALKDYILHHEARGASTLTQQLAKNLFRVRTEYSTGLFGYIPGLRMLIMKNKEWITAWRLERRFTKKEILAMYANTVDFGSNAFGIKTACKTYFNTTPRRLKTEQAAVLVGMLKATTYYNPLLHPDHSIARRNTVLDKMQAHGHLASDECKRLKDLDIVLDYSVENAYDGSANYFRDAVKNYLKDWCEETGVDLFTDGLKIYTTLDSRMQRYAEEAARQEMKRIQRQFDQHWQGQNPWQDERHQEIAGFIEQIARRTARFKQLMRRYDNDETQVWQAMNEPHTVPLFDYDHGTIEKEMSTMDSIRYMVRFMHCGLVAMEPETGKVKAWVGDVDFNSWKYDKVTAMRQPGSTFKLFVYSEAMNQGLTPVDRRQDSYFSMQVWDPAKKKEVTWAPTNANGYFTGAELTLRSAFAQSINSVAVKLGQELGINRVAATAHKMGIKSTLHETPSLALGSSDVTLEELVAAYATVANDGKRTDEPILVERVLDRDGNEIYHAPTSQQRGLSYRSAFLMQQMLMAGMREPGGTSMNLWGYVGKYPDTDFGGKTGTSNNHSDAWFVGVSPHLVAGAWVGGEYRSIHFRTGALGQGSRTALPICGAFFEKVLGDPAFKRYHGKFGPSTDPSITRDLYEGGGNIYPDSDTLSIDTLDVVEPISNDSILLD